MRKIILFSALLILSGCGSSDNETDDASSSICQRSDVNSQIFCALQRDYLWYSDLPTSIDPDSYSTPAALLEAVAAPQDRYSFILTRQEYEDRFINATFFGYGFSSVRVDNDTALQIAYVYDDGSAAQNGLRRGDKIVEIEGVSVAQWLSQQGLDWGDVEMTFYSDSMNDLPLLEKAHHPVATNPDARLRQLATERGWRILELFQE